MLRLRIGGSTPLAWATRTTASPLKSARACPTPAVVGTTRGAPFHTSAEEGLIRKDAWSKLPSRSVVRVAGPDAQKFLQGLTTNDFLKLENSMSCAFLNNQGRVLYDALAILQAPDTVLLDVSKSGAADLIKMLKRYKLRAKVEITDASGDISVLQAIGPNVGKWVDETLSAGSHPGAHILQDPRLRDLGARAFISEASHDLVEDLRGKGWGEVTEGAMEVVRVMQGVAQGPDEVPKGESMPLEYNFELFAGVAFNKGCYVGQELTARTHFRGQVRKRAMPFVLEGGGDTKEAGLMGAEGQLKSAIGYEGPQPEAGSPIVWASDPTVTIGKVISSTRGAGLGMVRLNHVTAASGSDGAVLAGGLKGHLLLPRWWDKVSGELQPEDKAK